MFVQSGGSTDGILGRTGDWICGSSMGAHFRTVRLPQLAHAAAASERPRPFAFQPMKNIRQVCASVVTLLAACLLHAADSKPIARFTAISDIETDDASGYATWVAKYNEVAKAR